MSVPAPVTGVTPAPVQGAERRIRFQNRALRVLVVIGLVLIGLITLLLIGYDAGPVAFLTGLVLATVPVPIYLWLALRIDRFEPEPLRLLAWAFFWGATASTFIALVLNTAGQAIVGSQFGADVGELYGGSVSAPVVEESAKAVVLFLIYRWRRWRLDSVLDGMVYAAMVGLGFAMTENVLYYSNAAVEGGVPLAATFFMRGVLSPFGHPVFTCMTGIGLGIAATTTRGWVRAVAPAAGLAGAIALHSLWNTSATVGDGLAFVGVYFLIMVPLFFGLICVALVYLHREGKVVREHLQPEVAAGVLTAGDVELLSSLRDRRRMVKAARRDGRQARRAARDFQLAATQLAFERRRATRGLPSAGPDPVATDREFAAALETLRG
ncbi:MAG TPA: PrsW family intramembrane metalloprotease, partial [Solirubrobacteraceae bacterium]|nr:PrsW family intramembrane metalloprotease [Solirubrobacteraceae bacterium]